MKKLEKKIVTILLSAFALLTLFLSSSVLFDLFGMRAKEGNFVPVVVWANFFSSLLYLVAVYGYNKKQNWMTIPMLTAVATLIVAQILFYVHIVNEGLYEERTVGALIFRISITILFTYLISRGKKHTKIINS